LFYKRKGLAFVFDNNIIFVTQETKEMSTIMLVVNVFWLIVLAGVFVSMLAAMVHYVARYRIKSHEARGDSCSVSTEQQARLEATWERLDWYERAGLLVMKVSGFFSWLGVLVGLTAETVTLSAKFMGYGWSLAILFALFALPGSREMMLRLLNFWFRRLFLDIMDVWVEEKADGVVHRTDEWGAYFWGRGAVARAVLQKWAMRLDQAIDEEVAKLKEADTLSGYCIRRPKRNITGGYVVGLHAKDFIYEGVMHDEEAPQCVSNLGMMGMRIIDT
jgi:hypothetical protein